ncbi:MAG: Huntington interacting protein HYPE [uncultured Sulfurovum sp.]|uniref:Huntington interacting protein HYPE n=1 Tax=uncultured Sulfurovum sp. TaxID=269237 RepID=A0A6S6TIM3_9BACT|nr:MAG: Huntington interacting protein HYPE [uncultured Sulfurovum sp.]
MNKYQPPYTITSKILTQVSNIVELLSELKYTTGLLNTPKLRKKNRIKSITGTLQIEGNTFTEEKVTSVINGTKVLGTVREVAEVEGAIKAYDFLEKYNYSNEKDLLLAHQKMMGQLLNNAGNYRYTNVGIGGQEGVTHVAPPPNMVQTLMGELFEWLNSTEEHLLIVSCVFHYEFEFIHPFSDGNGRLGRLWQSVILTKYKSIFSQIPIESVVRDNQANYYEALEASGSVGESTPFIEFMLEVIYKTLQKLQEENQKVGEKVGKKVGINLSENQKEIIAYMLENPKISAKKLSELVGISSRKIEENIKKLKEEEIIERVGANKGGTWKVLNIKS